MIQIPFIILPIHYWLIRCMPCCNYYTHFLYYPFLYYLIGYTVGVLLAHYPVNYTIKKLHEIRSIQGNNRTQPKKHSFNDLEGLVERTLFIFFLQIGVPELVLGWLTIKTAINVIYKRPLKEESDIRISYNIFLIGTGANLIFAFTGSMIITWGSIIITNGEEGLIWYVLSAPSLLYILSLCVCCEVNRKLKEATHNAYRCHLRHPRQR